METAECEHLIKLHEVKTRFLAAAYVVNYIFSLTLTTRTLVLYPQIIKFKVKDSKEHLNQMDYLSKK